MDTLQAVIIAILQGAAGLFPSAVSATRSYCQRCCTGTSSAIAGVPSVPGHAHLGGHGIAGHFWRDWWALFTGVIGVGGAHQVKESRRVFLLVVIATIPAVILGFLLEKFFRSLFGSPVVAASFLIVNGVHCWSVSGFAAERGATCRRCVRSTRWSSASGSAPR